MSPNRIFKSARGLFPSVMARPSCCIWPPERVHDPGPRQDHTRTIGACCVGVQEQAAGGEPPEGWSQRDWSVLRELARGDDALVGFQGLKRRLDLHPQALRRTLLRLVESGMVAKSERGYRLTEQGHDQVAGASVPRRRTPHLPVAGFLLPSHITPHEVEDRFAGRWFDGLHWYGTEPATGQIVLEWLTNGDTSVRLNAGQGALRVEAAGHGDPDRMVQAAVPLVAAVATWLRSRDPGPAS